MTTAPVSEQSRARWWPLSMRTWLVAGLLLALVAIGAVATVNSFGTASGGPLDEEGREYGFTDRFRAGAELTDGTLLFQFRGDGPVTLRKVESFGDGTFEQIGAVVAGPEREWVQDFFFRAFPPRVNWFGEFTDAEGAVIHPIDDDEDYGYQLLIGYRVTQATTPGVRSHVAVTYEYDGKTYRDEFRSRIVACPGGYRLHRCERIALSTVPDFLEH